MDKQYLNDEFNRFFDFPTEDKSQVSSVSCKLFAEHIASVARDEAVNAIESLLAENERWKAELAKYRDAPVVAWVEVVDSYEGPYHFNGEKLLNVGKHKLIVKPGEEK